MWTKPCVKHIKKNNKTTELACTVCELLIRVKMQTLESVNTYKIARFDRFQINKKCNINVKNTVFAISYLEEEKMKSSYECVFITMLSRS